MSTALDPLSAPEAAALREHLCPLSRLRPEGFPPPEDCPQAELAAAAPEWQRAFLQRLNGEELVYLVAYNHICALLRLQSDPGLSRETA